MLYGGPKSAGIDFFSFLYFLEYFSLISFEIVISLVFPYPLSLDASVSFFA